MLKLHHTTVEDIDDEGVNPVESFGDVVYALERDPVPRQISNGEESFYSAQIKVVGSFDARVSALECLFVKLTLAKCQRQDPPMVRGEVRRHQDPPERLGMARQHQFGRSVWETGSGLQSWQAVRHALESRSHAVRIQDRVSEVRGWKMF